MKFKSNITDQLTISYLAKSMSFLDLCKAVGKIPIKKLIVEPGKKPFIETYYKSPEELEHLNLKEGDSVHEYTNPFEPNKPFHMILNTNQLFTKDTKIIGTLSPKQKEIIESNLQKNLFHMVSELQENYKVTNTDKNSFLHKDWTTHMPSVVKFSPHVEEIDADNEIITLSCNTNVSYEELTKNNLLLQVIKKSSLFKHSDLINFKSEDFLKQNPDGTARLELKQNITKLTKTYKDQIQKQMAESYVQGVEDNLSNAKITQTTKTDTEKQLFEDIIKNSSVEQLAKFRTTGICTDLSDTKALEYITSIFRSYVKSKSIWVKSLTTQYNKAHDPIKVSSFKELHDIFNTYLQKSSQTPNPVEDNEIKSKIKSVDSETYQTITQKILDDWDNNEHGDLKPTILGVYEVEHIPIQKEFESEVEFNEPYKNTENMGKNCQRDTFYHGTSLAVTSLILGHSGKFETSTTKTGKSFGIGVYVADKSSKSAQYLSDKIFRQTNTTGTLMICEATLGECAQINNLRDYKNLFPERFSQVDYDPEDNPIYEDYSSVGVLGGRPEDNPGNPYDKPVVINNEWCIFYEGDVTPKYLIEMKVDDNND